MFHFHIRERSTYLIFFLLIVFIQISFLNFKSPNRYISMKSDPGIILTTPYADASSQKIILTLGKMFYRYIWPHNLYRGSGGKRELKTEVFSANLV